MRDYPELVNARNLETQFAGMTYVHIMINDNNDNDIYHLSSNHLFFFIYHPSVYPSNRLSIHPSIHPSVCPYPIQSSFI